MSRLLLVLLLICCCTIWSEGQEQSAKSGTDLIEFLLQEERWDDARDAIDIQVESLIDVSDFDSLALYLDYSARLARGLSAG
ncbi:MAG: hypothetical protein AAF598_17570, partial [Bacteroidota bacterium]